jgi:hypothetical protein
MEPAQYCIKSKENIVKFIHDVWPYKAYPYVVEAYDSKYLGFKREPWDDLAIRSTLFTIAAVPITREKFRVKRTSGSLEDSELFSFGIHTLNVKPGNFKRFDTFKRDEMKLGHKTIPNFETYPLEIATDLYSYIENLEDLAKKGVCAPISPDVFNIFNVFNKAVEEIPSELAHFLDEKYKRAALDCLKETFKDSRVIC